MRKPLKKRLLRALAAVLLGGLFLWLGASAWVAWRFTRRDRPAFAEPPPQVAWGHVEPLRLNAEDAQEIGAWLMRGDPDRPCVVLLHGNGGSRRDMLQMMGWLAEARCTAMSITLRCHGDSSGECNDFGYSARHDVIAAVDYLGREFPARPVFIVGRSLGAAAAVFAAGELGDKVTGYFLEQPYKDLRSAVWNRLRNRFPPVMDHAVYWGLSLWAPAFLPVGVDEVSPVDRVLDVPQTVPIVFAIGSADRHVLPAEVTAVFGRVESHARLVVFDGAAHEALDAADPDLYRASLFSLIERP